MHHDQRLAMRVLGQVEARPVWLWLTRDNEHGRNSDKVTESQVHVTRVVPYYKAEGVCYLIRWLVL